MEVNQVEPTSWFMQSTAGIENTQVDAPIVENQEIDTIEPQNEEVENSQEDQNFDESGIEIADSVKEVFEKLRNDTKYNLAFYENKPIEQYDDIAEFIDLNANIKYEKALSQIDQQWYQSKSPAFQQFAQMAELAGDDASKLYQMINTQKEIDDFDAFDTDDTDQAQVIVENYLKLKNEPEDVIRDEITDLKDRDILSQRAEKYKPLLVGHLEKQKEALLEKERENIIAYREAINQNESTIINFLSRPEIEGMSLQNEDKDIIYSHLTYNPQLNGFSIYKKIEDLQRNGEYEKLAKAILLLENEDRFNELYTTRIKNNVAKDLRGKIRFASDSVERSDNSNVTRKDNSKSSFNPFSK